MGTQLRWPGKTVPQDTYYKKPLYQDRETEQPYLMHTDRNTGRQPTWEDRETCPK